VRSSRATRTGTDRAGLGGPGDQLAHPVASATGYACRRAGTPSTPSSTGCAALRLTETDANGGHVEETIIRAYGLVDR
jgi:hypothetical protein